MSGVFRLFLAFGLACHSVDDTLALICILICLCYWIN